MSSLPWSSKSLKGTPVAADELMIIDSEDANPSTQNKRITIGTLPVIEVTTWTADHDAAGFDLLNVGGITVNNPLDSFQYIITPSAITADRILNLPLITSTDTLVAQSLAQTLTNKTFAGVFPNKFEDDGLVIQNPANTFNYTFQSTALAADRTITLPLLLSNDTLVTEAFIQTLTNKTLDDFSNNIHADTVHIQVRNETGGPLVQGEAVYISGFSVPNDLPLVSLADASSAATMPAVGVITFATIADNANGDVTISGLLTGPSTTGLTPNATLYVSETAGEFTDIKPTGTALIQNIGSVLKVGGVGVGVINVISTSRTNDLPNIADTNFWVGNASSVPTAVPMSGDATLANTGILTIATNAVTDAKTNTFTTTKISTLNKALLNTAIVYNDQANTFGDFAQTFPDNQLFIQNPAATFEYQIIAAAIAADRTLTLPLLTGNDTAVTEAHTQTLTNKTIDGDDNTIIDINETQMNVSSGASGTVLTSNGVGLPPTYQANDGAQTPWTSNIDAATFSLLNLGGLELNNPADTFQYIVTPAAIVADRILNLPLMTGTDTLVLNDFAAILTNKTITAAANTLTIASTDLTDTGVIVLTDQTNTFGDFAQIFPDNQLFIQNPAATFEYQIIAAAIAADRTITLPLLAGNDTFVTEAFTQTLTNKTIDGDLNTIIDINETQLDVSVGASGTILTSNGVGLPPTYQANDGAQTPWTSNIDAATFSLLNLGGLELNNPADTFQYIITPAAIVADRILNLPLLTGTDTFVTAAFIQTLTNKTFDLTDNTLTGTTAEFNTALSDGDFATLAGTESLTNKTFNNTNEFEDDGLLIQNPADTFNYIFQSSAIAADRITTLPLLTGSDTFVFEAHIQTLTNKTFPGTSPNEFEDDGLLIQNPANTFNYIFQSAAIVADRTITIPLLTASDTFAFIGHAQSWTAKQTFQDDSIEISNPADTFQFILQSSAIVADRIATLPLLTTGDTFAFEAHTQTLTNKTLGTATAFSVDFTLNDGVDVILNATTGSTFGTATSQKLSFYGVTPVVQPTVLTTAETTLTFVDENTPDFALSSLTTTSPAGFATLDEAQALVEVVANNQARIGELETKLQALGLLA
jgi:hypothetical protein